MKLDRIDFLILGALQRDAALSNKELARRVRLAPSSCLERARKLRAAGILTGIHADVAPWALGIQIQALIRVRLNQHTEKQVLSFRNGLLSRPEVVSLFHLAGSDDFLVHVALRDVQHIRTFGSEALTSHPLVSHVETSVVFEHRRSNLLPNYALDE